MALKSHSVVRHWRYEDGTREDSVGNLWKHDPMPRGWYCWVWPAHDDNFMEWMDQHCPTADHTFRFNSGNPMHTVYISSDAEAVVFALKYNTHG